jgi:hypothetical protein
MNDNRSPKQQAVRHAQFLRRYLLREGVEQANTPDEIGIFEAAAFLESISDEGKEIERAYGVLQTLGIPRERARSIPNGIMVLDQRCARWITALRAETERLRLLLRPYCKHQGTLYDGHHCMDCGLSPASPGETAEQHPRSLAEGVDTAGRQQPSKLHDAGSNPAGDATHAMSQRAQQAALDEPLTEAELAHIVKWYEDEAITADAATHDCHVVQALRELLRLKAAKQPVETTSRIAWCGDTSANPHGPSDPPEAEPYWDEVCKEAERMLLGKR